MKKLLFLSLTLLTLSCSTEERNLNCYNSEYGYEQLNMDEDFIGVWYRTDNPSNISYCFR